MMEAVLQRSSLSSFLRLAKTALDAAVTYSVPITFVLGNESAGREPALGWRRFLFSSGLTVSGRHRLDLQHRRIRVFADVLRAPI